jgi:NADP-dependent 3-hydroxy acid dehydrogenase YdfG
LAGRNVEKLKKTSKEIGDSTKNKNLHVLKLDLEESKSVIEFVENFKKMDLNLDYLVLNAGVQIMPYTKTKDGFESNIGINHLSHFQLTNLLLPIMVKTKSEKRIIVVSSGIFYDNSKNFIKSGKKK